MQVLVLHNHTRQVGSDRIAALGASRRKVLRVTRLTVQALSVLVSQRALHLDQLHAASVTFEAVLMVLVVGERDALLLNNSGAAVALGAVDLAIAVHAHRRIVSLVSEVADLAVDERVAVGAAEALVMQWFIVNEQVAAGERFGARRTPRQLGLLVTRHAQRLRHLVLIELLRVDFLAAR
jgi:hypothetical protein